MNGALAAFATAAGVDPGAMSLFIRTLVMALVLFWAGWLVSGSLHAYRHGSRDISDLLMQFLRALFVVTLVTVLVFVPTS